MKIFFMQPKHFRCLSFKAVSRTLLVTLLACLFISGSVTPFFRSSTEVASPGISPGNGEVSVFSSPLDAGENVWIWVNGEKTARISDNRATVSIDMDSAIEIMSETDREFTVTLTAGDNVELMGETRNIRCRKGINYICRSVLN